MPWCEHAHPEINKYINKCKSKDVCFRHGDQHSGSEVEGNGFGLGVLHSGCTRIQMEGCETKQKQRWGE